MSILTQLRGGQHLVSEEVVRAEHERHPRAVAEHHGRLAAAPPLARAEPRVPGEVHLGMVRVRCSLELETKVHTKVRNHGEGPY